MDPEEFYRRARVLRSTGVYEFAIELYLSGLSLESDDVAAHQELRETAVERAANGGKPLGMFEKFKVESALRKADAVDKAKMLAAEKLLAYDPAELTYMLDLLKHAQAGGFHSTAAWIESIIQDR
jgi:hypothetical protein